MQPPSRRGSKDLISTSQELILERRMQQSMEVLNTPLDRLGLMQKMRNPSLSLTSSTLELRGSRNLSLSEIQFRTGKNSTLPNQPVAHAQSNLAIKGEGRRGSLTIRYNNRNSGISLDTGKERNGSIRKSNDALNVVRRGSIDTLLFAKHRGSYDVSFASDDVPTLTRLFRRRNSSSRIKMQRKQLHNFVTIGIMQAGFSISVGKSRAFSICR